MKNGSLLKKFGSKCLIVTGRASAVKSGALDDVKKVLEDNGILYEIFDEIEPNPQTVTCKKAGDFAISVNADFIFGIGGGSVLDASKAVAIYAKHPSLLHSEIYNRKTPAEHLPVILLGTTAGTGSEVTGVSVLTNSDNGLKKSISGADCYAEISFCDYKYTASASVETKISTALDAFAHAVEAYVANSSNHMSEIYSLTAISILRNYVISEDIWNNLNERDLEELYIASIYAGLAINIAGTCFPHTVGYFLTENHNVPHGKACASLMPELLLRTKKYCPEKLEAILDCMNTDIDTLILYMKKLSCVTVSENPELISEISLRWKDGVKNFDRTPGGFCYTDAETALKNIIC